MMELLPFLRAWLLNPHPRVTNPEKIQRSRLLSVILLVLIVLITAILSIVIRHDPEDINEPTVQGAFLLTGIMLIMYILNRLGETGIAALGFILPFIAIFVYIPFYSGESPIFLAFLMMPIILTAIFFSVKRTSIFAIGILALVGVLLSLVDQTSPDSPYWNLRNMWFFLILGTGLILTFMLHLSNLEQIRQHELKRINKELENDIELRERAENALRLSEVRMRSLVENSPDFILELDRSGVIRFINRYEEEYLGKNIRNFLPEDQQASAFQAINQAFETGKPVSTELQTISRMGEVSWDAVRLGPMEHDNTVTRLIAIITEITERKRAEAERESLINELGNRNAELERFTYTVSHELKTPIVTIKGFLGSVEKDFRDGKLDKVLADLARISKATDNMHTTLSDLLALSRIGHLVNPSEEFPLSELVKEAIESTSGTIRAHGITLQVDPSLPVIYGDRKRLREVYENLIDNAAKYMANQKHPEIVIGIRNEKESIYFVKDNGMGVEPQYQKKIFGLFEKLNPDSEGTGIGLAIVKRIIETHGGRVWVESDGTGKGSSFCFTIPERRKSEFAAEEQGW